MSSVYYFIIQLSIYGSMLLNNLYMADLIEKNVYTQQVSE